VVFLPDIKGIARKIFLLPLKYISWGGGVREGRMKYGETRDKNQKVEGLI
jgi:hypothetical protein